MASFASNSTPSFGPDTPTGLSFPMTTSAPSLDSIISESTGGTGGGASSSTPNTTSNWGSNIPLTSDSETNNKSSSGSYNQGAAKPIPQEERLWTVRPRSTGRRDRGPRAKMRILPLDKQAFLNNSNVKDVPKDLFSEDENLGWNDFFLTDVQCQMSEKAQVMEVFGDNHVTYYFGKAPTMFTLSGLVFDNIDNDWFTQFISTYENFLRGSKLAKNYALLEIMLPNIKVIGSVMSFNYGQSSQRDTDIQFSMQVIAKAVDMLPLSIPEVDAASLLNVVKWPDAIGNLPRESLNSLKTYANLSGFIKNPITPSTDIMGIASGLSGMFNPLNMSSMSLSPDLMDGLKDSISKVGGPISAGIGSGIGMCNAAGDQMMGTMNGFMGQASSGLSGAMSISPDQSMMSLDLAKIQDTTSGLQSGLQSSGLSDMTSKLTDGLSSTGEGMLNSVSGALPDILSSGSGLLAQAGGMMGGMLGGNNQVLGGIASTLTGFKSGMFSPVFGFLSSITKIITSVTGDISKVLGAFTAPINSVLRDITMISKEVIGITNLITNSVNQVVGIPKQTLNNIMTTINSLRKAAGAISRLPINISDAFGSLFKGGNIFKGAVILKSSHGRRINPAVILNSGRAWTPARAMVIPSSLRRFA